MSAASTELKPQATTWSIDPVHSVVEFKVRHLMISNIKGHFVRFSGSLHLDESEIGKSSVEAAIDAASVTTREAQRDAHLKSAEFFDVERFPTLNFKSHRVARTGNSTLEVTGDLTIRGVTKQTVFEVEGPSAPVKDPWGKMRIGLSAVAKIQRKDFGVGPQAAIDTGAILLGDEVTITLDIQLVKA